MRLVADNLWTYVEGAPPTLLDPVTSYMQDGAWFTPQFKKKLWDGRVRFVKFDPHRKQYRFPTGLLPAVVDFLESREWRYSLEDNRQYEYVEPCITLGDRELGSITIRPYQQRAVESALTHGRGVLKIATGGGKTVIGAAIVKSWGQRAVWFVHKLDLLYQTQAVLQERLERPIGIVGDSLSELQDITVAMIQTTHNAIADGTNPAYYHWLQGVYGLISDEAHHLQAQDGKGNQQQRVAEHMRCIYRIGLSASAHLQGAGLAIQALCGPVICNISATELIQGGYLVQPRIWLIRIDETIHVDAEDKFPQLYKRGIVDSVERLRMIGEVLKIWKYEKRKPIIFVDQKQHAKKILSHLDSIGINAGYIHGEVKNHERKEIIERLRVGDIDVLVAIAATMGEGTDVPFLDALINATGKLGGGNAKTGDSGSRTQQFLGRILRPYPGKKRADYVDFITTSHKMFLKADLARVETLENEGYTDYIKYWTDYELL